MRTAFDLSPLYRSMIGVDRMAELIDSAMRRDEDGGAPPYDIERTGEDAWRISVATVGFKSDEIEVTAQPNLLVVAGRKAQPAQGRTFLHRGFTGGDFSRQFELADHVVVKSAHHENGVLSIDLARELPEALKPHRIEIGTSAEPRRIEDQTDRRAA